MVDVNTTIPTIAVMTVIVPNSTVMPVAAEILEWIGLPSEPDYCAICNDAITMYNDLLSLHQNDITKLSEAFSRRTQTNGKIHFDVRKCLNG